MEHTVDVSAAAMAAIVARHRLGTRSWAALPSLGASMSIYALGDTLIMRVPQNTPATIAGLALDPLVIPAARAAGVRTPALVAFDASCELLPVPYAVYERVQGEPLDRLGLPRMATPGVWRALGHDLALLHTGVTPDGPAGTIPHNAGGSDGHAWLGEVSAAGLLPPADAAWLHGWLDRLEPWARTPVTPRLVHGDVNAGNVMVDPATHEFRALIDWGGTYWGDPIWDFVPVSLDAVPQLLEGYRAVTPLDDDVTAEGRVLWNHTLFVCFGLWRGKGRGAAWATPRVAAVRVDVERFLARPETSWIAALAGS